MTVPSGDSDARELAGKGRRGAITLILILSLLFLDTCICIYMRLLLLYQRANFFQQINLLINLRRVGR